MRYILFLALLGACAPKEPNHLGNPLAWPVQAITVGIENGIYQSKRDKVSAFVSANFPRLKVEAKSLGGTALNIAMDMANVTEDRRASLVKELAANPKLYLGQDTEPMVVALMVHGN